jgi:hypothetical protein
MNAEDVTRALLDALDEGLFQRVYRLASVADVDVLRDLGEAGFEVESIASLQGRPTEDLDPHVDRYIAQARRSAAASGLSLGAGGWVGLPAGLTHLVVVVLRLAQRISLAYGFDYTTDRGEIELWKALATSVGADVDFEGTEAELMRMLPAVVTGTGTFQNPLLLKAFQAVVVRLAASAGMHLTRWVPVVGGGTGLVINYVQVGRVGRGLKSAFRQRHTLSSFDRGSAIVVDVLHTP